MAATQPSKTQVPDAPAGKTRRKGEALNATNSHV
jgi:hypothetical protein